MSRNIPEFNTLEEEIEFWQTHDTTEFWDDLEDVNDVIFRRPPEWDDSTKMLRLEAFQKGHIELEGKESLKSESVPILGIHIPWDQVLKEVHETEIPSYEKAPKVLSLRTKSGIIIELQMDEEKVEKVKKILEGGDSDAGED